MNEQKETIQPVWHIELAASMEAPILLSSREEDMCDYTMVGARADLGHSIPLPASEANFTIYETYRMQKNTTKNEA